MVLRRKENQHGYLMALSKMSLLLDVRYYSVGLFSFVSLVLFFPPVAAFFRVSVYWQRNGKRESFFFVIYRIRHVERYCLHYSAKTTKCFHWLYLRNPPFILRDKRLFWRTPHGYVDTNSNVHTLIYVRWTRKSIYIFTDNAKSKK